MNYENVFKKLNGTSTLDRKEGLHDLLEIFKKFSKNDSTINKSDNLNQNGISLKNKLKEGILLKSLGRLLRDPDWEIKRESIEVVMVLILKEILEDEIDSVIFPLIPHVISCLSDSKVTVRKSAMQCLHEFWLKSHDLSRCLSCYVEYGFSPTIDISQRRDNNSALKVLLTSHFSNADLSPIIYGVLRQIEIDINDDRLISIVCDVLQSIKKVTGEEHFTEYLQEASPSINALYNRCLSRLNSRPNTNEPRNTNSTTSKNIIFSKRSSTTDSPQSDPNAFFLTAIPATNNFQSNRLPPLTSPTANTLYLGFIPPSVMNDIENNKKLEAIEEIHNLFQKHIREKQIAKISPHFYDFILLIQRLMDDKYLVVMNTFKLLIDLVSAMGSEQVDTNLDVLLQLLRMALLHNMNGDAIILKYVMAYSMVLFQKCNTKQLLVKLCDQYFMTDMKQASVRQTSIDIVISALLKFPSDKFDLDFLTSKVSQRLLDKKLKVKQAALECISVIGYTYGNGKVNTLLKMIEQSTKVEATNNIGEIVQARLSRHRLPRVDEQGLVVYDNDNDKNNNQRQYSIIDLENSSSDNSPISSANALEKRRPSAGKVRGRAKFPWDQNEGNCQSSAPFSMGPGIISLNQIQPSEAIPIQVSQGSISANNKHTIHEGKMIKKLNDMQVDPDLENHSTRNISFSRRSYSSEVNSPMSTNTSGYSSTLSTSRRNTDSFIKHNNDCLTATNSVNVTPRNPSTSRVEDVILSEESPIPTKPTLGRSAGSRRKELDPSDQIPTSNTNNFRNQSVDPNLEAVESTMLDSVRNSAAKKKALTIFNSSTQKPSMDNTQSTKDVHSKLLNGTKSFENNAAIKISEPVVTFNPFKGTTFKPNPQYDGLIIGKSVSTPEISEPLKKKLPVKGMFDNNSGNVSQRSTVQVHQNDSKKASLNIDSIMGGNNVPTHIESSQNSKTTSKVSSTVLKETDFSDSIVGKSIVEKNGFEEDSDEELQHKGIMSNTLRESLSIKRQKAAIELNSSKPENVSTVNSPSPHSAPGSGCSQAVIRKPPMAGYHHNNTTPSSAGNDRDNVGYDTLPPSRKPLRPALGNSTPKKVKPLSQTLPNPLPLDPSNISPAPLPNPDKSITEFLHLVQNEDWEHKVSALIIAQSLAQYHSETLISHPTDLHSICIAICKECKNLRSQVAKCAIQTVGVLFTNLRKVMDSELDIIIINMLSKGGDGSSIFLRQDVEMTMSIMIDNVTAQRAILPLITNGADNKNAAIRRLVASNLMQITEKIGAVKILSCAKEITEKVLHVVGKFVQDSNQETRYYGKRILLELIKNPDFDKIVGKNMQPKDIKLLNEAIENLKLKGIGDPPHFSQSASIRRSGPISRGASAGNLVALEQKSSSLSRGNSRSMSRLPGSDLSSTDDDDWLSKTCTDLSSSDFRLRQSGLESLVNRQETFGLHIPPRGMAKLLNELIPRLNDNNSKVAVTALTVCRKIIPSICSTFPTEFLSRLINTIALNFASKSSELRENTTILMSVCFNNFDPNLLIQPCVEAMNKANLKSKPALIENMNELLHVIIENKSALSSRSSGAINRHLAPQIGLLLEQNRTSPASLRDPLYKLVLLSFEIVGFDIIESVSRERNHTVKQTITDIINTQHLSL